MFGNKKPTPYTDMAIGFYSVIMFRKIAGVYTEIDREKVKVEQSKFRYKGKKDFIKIDVGKIAFRDKKRNYFAFDYDTGNQIFFNEKEFPTKKITIDEVDNYVNKGIISQIVAGLETIKSDKKIGLLIVVGALGGTIGFIVGYLINNNIHPALTFLAGLI